MPPRVGMTWPSRLEPAPNGVTAMPRSFASARTPRDLLRRRRIDDEVGPPWAVKRDVGAVEVTLESPSEARVGAEDLGERLSELLGRHRHENSVSDGSPGATLSTAQRRLAWTPRSAASPSLVSQFAKKSA